jgi:alpha-D-ribose 1-methylphosphonate 5-triphosphate diphosphatase
MTGPFPMPRDAASLPDRLTLANARLVLPQGVMEGAVEVSRGEITGLHDGTRVAPGALDCEGDFVAPGLVELHTDNLERHLRPRPTAHWPHGPAIVAHDAELASTGITTVYDALRIGSIKEGPGGGMPAYARALATEILHLHAAGALKISHRIHLRAEICSDTLEEELDSFGPDDRVGLLSLMDHTPGQRQFTDIGQYEAYIRGKYAVSKEDFDAYVGERIALGDRVRDRHEAASVAAAQRLGAALASHDDTTVDHVARSAGYGITLAEFPTTGEAARACHQHGIAVMMGAPNLIRGGSHSGNVAAGDLAEAGLLDVVSSDYVPAALLGSAVKLAGIWGDMARAVATVTAAPAKAAGLIDRGRIAEGLRADLIRFRVIEGVPVLRGVWVQGARVA